MVMTAKVDMKKLAIIAVAIVGIVLALVLIFGGNADAQPTATGAISNNDARVQFLKNYGWEVASSPVESGQVRIPEKSTAVYDRYNALQKTQGFDLSQYAGKIVMRYVYKINNYPGATDPVYATLLVYKNQVIGGDITDTSAKGAVQGFQKPLTPTEPEQTVESAPETT